MMICIANSALSLSQPAMAESEGRWPRICAPAHETSQQSEARHVL